MPEADGSSGECGLTLDSHLEELERLQRFIDDFCNREALPEQTRFHLSLALEEMFVNSVEHGGCEPGQGAIRLAIRVEGPTVRITFSDAGIAFNPLQVPAPELADSPLSRPIGGLGIHLVRSVIPSIRYERHDGRNYLYLSKPVEQDCACARQEGRPKGGIDADCNGDHPG